MRTLVLLLLVLITSTMLSGCSTTVLHPIYKSDIVRMKQGQEYSSEKDGWFISDFYLKEVAKSKVKGVVTE